jgi:hypothetical protein
MPRTVDDPTVEGAWPSLKFYVTPRLSTGADAAAFRGGLAVGQGSMQSILYRKVFEMNKLLATLIAAAFATTSAFAADAVAKKEEAKPAAAAASVAAAKKDEKAAMKKDEKAVEKKVDVKKEEVKK